MTVGEAAEWGPKGRKSRPKAESGGEFLGRRQQALSPPSRGYGGALWAPPAGFGVEPWPPKGFLLFSALRMASPDTVILLWITKMENSYPIQCWVKYCAFCWCCMMFSVYETKFTVGKSKVMVFTAGKRRDQWGGWELDTLGWEFPQRCLDTR